MITEAVTNCMRPINYIFGMIAFTGVMSVEKVVVVVRVSITISLH